MEIECTVTFIPTPGRYLTDKEIEDFKQKELQYSNKDDECNKTKELRNRLESLIYEIKRELDKTRGGGDLLNFADDEQIANTLKLTEWTLSWLEENREASLHLKDVEEKFNPVNDM